VSKQRRAEFFLLLVTIVWGSTFVISKALLDHATPLMYTGIRFLFSTVLILIFFHKRVVRIPSSTLVKGSILGIAVYVGFVLQTAGLQYTTASKNAFFTGMLVVLTPIIHYLMQNTLKLVQKPLRIGNMVGVVLAAIGLFLLTNPSGGGFNIGDAMTLGCALFFAFYIVYLDYASSEPDKLQLTFVQFIVCSILGFISAFIFEHSRIEWTGDFILSLLYLVVFATVISMWVQNYYQGDTTPTRAAVIFSLEPVIAAIFAYFVRGENIGVVGIVGGVTVMTGLLLSEFSDGIPILKKVFLSGIKTD
jgi:drug/metabolite transporter (DMT)-like permease